MSTLMKVFELNKPCLILNIIQYNARGLEYPLVVLSPVESYERMRIKLSSKISLLKIENTLYKTGRLNKAPDMNLVTKIEEFLESLKRDNKEIEDIIDVIDKMIIVS